VITRTPTPRQRSLRARRFKEGPKTHETKKFIPLAITMLLAVPTFLTSCQEDAPEINYTMSVSVINDFTKVVEAIDSLPATSCRGESGLRDVGRGYYWSSSLSTAYSYNARYLDFGSGRHDRNVNPPLLRVLGAARPPINLSSPRRHDAIESI